MSHVNIHDLFRACEVGDKATVERILGLPGRGALGADAQDEEDITALQVAAANDQVIMNGAQFISRK